MSGRITELVSPEVEGRVVGVGYVRIPSPDLVQQAAFYRPTFGLAQIGGILDHALMFNVGTTAQEAAANPAVRVILDSRMRPNAENPFVFVVHGLQSVMRRAVSNGAKVEMEPLIARNGFHVGKFTDPAGNWIELLEEGTDLVENLTLRNHA